MDVWIAYASLGHYSCANMHRGTLKLSIFPFFWGFQSPRILTGQDPILPHLEGANGKGEFTKGSMQKSHIIIIFLFVYEFICCFLFLVV